MLDVSVGSSPPGCLYILHGKALHCGDRGTEAMFFGPRDVRIEERAPCNRMQEAPAHSGDVGHCGTTGQFGDLGDMGPSNGAFRKIGVT